MDSVYSVGDATIYFDDEVVRVVCDIFSEFGDVSYSPGLIQLKESTFHFS